MTMPHELLERDATIDRIVALVELAPGRGGSVVFVDGEAGAGKTSVVRAVIEAVADRTQVLVGSCDPMTTPRPFGPLRDIAETHRELEELATSLDTPHAAFGALLEHLRESIRPVLLIIEDLHWADDGTLDMVTYLGRRIESTRAVMVVTLRGNEIAPGNPVGITAGSLLSRRDSVHRVSLEPLSVDAVRHLAAERADEADSIHRVTGGNAFFVTELLAGDEALPATVQEAVRARVGRLHPAARAAVEVVSVAPRHLEGRYLKALVQSSDYVIEDAVHAGVLIGDPHGYRFRHELARLAVEDAVPPPRRVELHRRILQLLTDDDSKDVSRLAHHAIMTGDEDLILRFALPAARDAAAGESLREAASLYRSTHPFASSLDVDDRLEFLTEYATTLIAVDRQVDALEVSREVLDLAVLTDEPRRIADAQLIHARAMWLNGRTEAANQMVEEAIRLREPFGDSEELARTLYVAGTHQMLDRHREAAIALAERSLAMARRLGSQRVETLATIGLGTAELAVGDPDRGIELLEAALSMADDDRLRVSALSMLGSGGGEVKEYDRAFAWLERAIAIGTTHDETYAIAYATAWMSRIRAEQGRWDEALAYAEQVTSLPPEVARISPVTALGTEGRIGVRRGNTEAVDALERAIELGKTGAIQHIWVPLCATAEFHIYGDRPERAVGVLTEPLARILDTDTLWGRGEIAFWMWMAGGLDEVPDHLADPYRLMIEGSWEQAAEGWRRIGAPYEEAMALSLGPAEAAFDALRIFDGLGARPMGRRVRGRLRAEGVDSIPRGPGRATVADPDGLTPRQRQILELMAESLSNREIADRLFVSTKTVENHVSAILLKLDVTSRQEAVAQASTSL
jgi:DNA-binding CsgD family transcriptional regulator/tetratricopeptide (TPR) repeat protein